jgi:small subunit ribosomal protein S20
MAHSKQAFKRARQSERKRIVNKATRSRVKSAIKLAHTADAGQRPVAQSVAMKRIDKAAKIHAIHANAAARYKSRLAKALNKAKAAGK